MVKNPNIEQAFKKVCAALIEVKRDNISTGKFLTYKRLLLLELGLNARKLKALNVRIRLCHTHQKHRFKNH